jgi:hypothetical protein
LSLNGGTIEGQKVGKNEKNREIKRKLYFDKTLIHTAFQVIKKPT